jgi:UDP-N-acetyl-D-mannosaminuronate dehydrogenase
LGADGLECLAGGVGGKPGMMRRPIGQSYVSWRVERELGQRFRFVELASDINSHMPDYFVLGCSR